MVEELDTGSFRDHDKHELACSCAHLPVRPDMGVCGFAILCQVSMLPAIVLLTLIADVESRGKMIRTIGPDDWTCAASLVSFTLFLGFQIATASHGRGLPRDLLSTHDAQAALEVRYVKPDPIQAH